jgi:transposase
MLSLSSGFRYFLYSGDTDFRCGMDSLSGLVRKELSQDPLNGAIYIFFNRSRSQVKLLHFEGGGFSLYH